MICHAFRGWDEAKLLQRLAWDFTKFQA